jgi:hypothetical protein
MYVLQAFSQRHHYSRADLFVVETWFKLSSRQFLLFTPHDTFAWL